jgi:23S rRNA-/tRNA-specific pseudouridylate synthase
MIQPKVNVFGYPKLGITKVLKHTISSAKTWSHYSDIQTVTLELEILTGRTHQIRVQLSEIGLPILGDYLYHPASPKDSPLMLTAFKLEFTDCDNKKQCIELDTL